MIMDRYELIELLEAGVAVDFGPGRSEEPAHRLLQIGLLGHVPSNH